MNVKDLALHLFELDGASDTEMGYPKEPKP
jgi:hypothetical protein